MERRTEPRLNTAVAAVVHVLREQPCEFQGTIINASGRGFRLTLNQPLNLTEVVRLRADGHSTFAVVRYCEALSTGDFAIGMERTDEWTSDAEIPTTHQLPIDEHNLKTHFGDVRTAAIRELFAVKKPAKPSARKRYPAIAFIAAAVLAVVALAGAATGFRYGLNETAEAQAAPEPPPPAPTPPAPATVAAPAPDPNPRHLIIEARNDSWVLLCADGRRIFEKLIPAGAREEFDFEQQAMVRTGNAGGLNVEAGTRRESPLGDIGKVRAVKLTADAVEDLDPNRARSCRAF